MRQFILPALLAASYVSADGSCPGTWWDLAGDLENTFFEDGTCSDPARAAIRLAFHDCFPGSCDGSIIKAEECWKRPENIQMYAICTTLGEKADYYGVSYADIIGLSTLFRSPVVPDTNLPKQQSGSPPAAAAPPYPSTQAARTAPKRATATRCPAQTQTSRP